MNGFPKLATERLYLQKDEHDEIYVDSLLHQHHIDGIRFLFKQYKKKNPGVIINNPLGYGNSMQVALFLGAIQRLLDKPILILCEESEELTWLEHIQKQPQCNNNVAISAESPFMKKSIFINTMERLEQFSRRDWSVMVVDDDAFLREKTLQTKFKADFKIWITPVDMKENLETLASIFKWVYPKEKLNIDEYKPKPGDIKDAVAKALLLDEILKDVVCRTHLLTPFDTPYEKSEETPKKVTKKNKDATGTKIKRSKRLSDSAGASNGVQEHSDMEPSAAKIPRKDTKTSDFSISNFISTVKSSKACDVKDTKNTEMDVESFILNEKPIAYEPFQNYIQNDDGTSHSVERTDLIENEPTIFNSPDKMSSFSFSDDAMDVADNQENVDSDTNSESLVPRPKDESSQDNNVHDCNVGRKLVKAEMPSDNVFNFNEIKHEYSETDNPVATSNEIKPNEPVKVEEPDKVVESPKKDIDSKVMDIGEQIFKKFQGSLLDRLF